MRIYQSPNLGLTEPEAEARFAELQKKLVPLWRSIQSFNQDEQTIVVVPSMTIDFDCSSSELQAYEERFLFLLLAAPTAARASHLRHVADDSCRTSSIITSICCRG